MYCHTGFTKKKHCIDLSHEDKIICYFCKQANKKPPKIQKKLSMTFILKGRSSHLVHMWTKNVNIS